MGLIAASKRLVGLPLVCMACLACAAQQPANSVPPASRTAEDALDPQTVCGWPRRWAGWELQVIADRYVLYGSNRESAKAMQEWLNAELTSFERRYGTSGGCGLVFMLQANRAPLPEIEGWRSEIPDRPRVIDWSSNDRRQATVHSRSGRPYCFFKKPYFCESLVLGRKGPSQAGVIDESMPKVAWVCALTTDAHVKAAFDEKAREHERRMNEEARDMPADQRLIGWMFYGTYKLCVPTWRSIDIEMMHLQRREALWQALIRNSEMPDEQQTEALSSLRDQTDEAWKKLYFSRPYD